MDMMLDKCYFQNDFPVGSFYVGIFNWLWFLFCNVVLSFIYNLTITSPRKRTLVALCTSCIHDVVLQSVFYISSLWCRRLVCDNLYFSLFHSSAYLGLN